MDEKFPRAFESLADCPDVGLKMSAVEAWCVMVAIVVACWNPKFNRTVRKYALRVAGVIRSIVARTPELERMAAEGWALIEMELEK